MSEFGVALLGLALIGTASSTIFLVLALGGVVKSRKQAGEQKRNEHRMATSGYPPVSILKPLHGMEPQLERNLESFFLQDYPNFEILFAMDTDEDSALPVVQKLCLKYPAIRSQIIVTGEPPWPNPPAYAFSRMAAAAQHDVLATSDSDVEVNRDHLKTVVAPLTASQTGMVTCVYRGLNTGGFWSALDAIGMSVEMTAGVLVANLLEGIKFGLGPTIVVRRDALEAIGGYRALGDYFSNDFMIGNLVAARGFTVTLSRHVISHVVPTMTFKRMWQRQVRWATGTKHSRAKGHFGTVFVFAVPYGLLGLAAGLLLHRPGLGLTLLGLSIVNRLVEALVIGWGVTRDRECLRKPWLYLVRDLLGFAVWVASYLSRNMRWRDGRFELVEGGRILVRDRNGNLVRLSDALAAGDESTGD